MPRVIYYILFHWGLTTVVNRNIIISWRGNMQIKGIRVYIEPSVIYPSNIDLTIRVDLVGEDSVCTRECIGADDFATLFDRLIDRAKLEILRHIVAIST
jgi:hypothetical protein